MKMFLTVWFRFSSPVMIFGEQAIGQITDGEVGKFLAIGDHAQDVDAMLFDLRQARIAEIGNVGHLVDDDPLAADISHRM